MAICPQCHEPLSSPHALCSRCGDTRPPNATRTNAAATASSAASRGFVPGTMLSDRYRIIALLGRGGMGEVYRADDLTLGQPVALKFLPAIGRTRSGRLRRFRNEVRIARQVSHPNVCRVYDIGEVDGSVFLSMEYVDGEDLASLLRRIGRLPPDKGARDRAQAVRGPGRRARERRPAPRSEARERHARRARAGAHHRLRPRRARRRRQRGRRARAARPPTWRPSSSRAKRSTTRSDIYALGLVLYELFTGKRAASTAARCQSFSACASSPRRSTRRRSCGISIPRSSAIILRCLEPRSVGAPASALAVAAALPGGDPLAAALAAGETPSPQLVAAAGEDAGVSRRYAFALFACVLAGITAAAAMAVRTSALERLAPEYPPQVLIQRARDVIASAGYEPRAADAASGFAWNTALVDAAARTDKPRPDWDRVVGGSGPSVLRFWYRQSDTSLTGMQFHSDLLIPGEVNEEDPPPIDPGMITVVLDARGRLVRFEASPPRVLAPGAREHPAANWQPLFTAAGLEPGRLQPTEPLWTWLGTSDSRFAWTGTWPQSTRPLRVEAAALRGKPVGFALRGAWDVPGDQAGGRGDAGEGVRIAIYGMLALVICAASAWLAWRNLSTGRGDRRGAFRLGAFAFLVHMALWLTTSHLVLASVLGMFFLALCTAIFYGVVLWTIYLAFEPYVRRHWPHSADLVDAAAVRTVARPPRRARRAVGCGARRRLDAHRTRHGPDRRRRPAARADVDRRTPPARPAAGARRVARARPPRRFATPLLFFFLLFLLGRAAAPGACCRRVRGGADRAVGGARGTSSS